MLKARYVAVVAVALGVSACASDPYYDTAYGAPRYAPGPYAANGAYSDFGRVVAIDVVRGRGGSSASRRTRRAG